MNRYGAALVCGALLSATNVVCAAPGDLDCSFATNGVLNVDLAGTEAAYDAALTADGALLVLNPDLRVTRITAGGDVDTAFGSGGSVTPVIPGAYAAQEIAVDGQGRILIAGLRSADGDEEVYVARLTPAGALDASFGGGSGWIGFDWSSATASAGFDRVGDLLVASGDRPVLVGWYDDNGPVNNPSNANVAVARLTSAGQLDPAFGSGGIATGSSPGSVNDDARDGAIDADGRIYTIGAYTPTSGPRNTVVMRFTAAGALDAGFASAGVAILDLSAAGTDDFGRSMTIDGSNRPVLLGQGTDDPLLARLTSGGALDTGFGTGGIVQRSFIGGQDVPERVLVQADGRIYVTGWPIVGGTFRFASMRFTGAGALDTSWGGTGVVTTIVGSNMRAYSAVLTAAGRLVMAGGLNNDTRLIAVRYLTDGTVLPTSTVNFTLQTPNPSLRTDPVQFTVEVAASGVTPAGTVTLDDGVDRCTATLVPIAAGRATGTCAIAFTTAGTRTVTARNDGDGTMCRGSATTSQQVRYRVTAAAGPGGTISPSGLQGAAPGSTLSFSLNPASTHTVRAVAGCGGTRSGNTYTTAPITADCAVDASFNAIPIAQPGTLDLLEDAGPTAGQLGATDDGDPLNFTISQAPTRGTVLITNPATGAYTYTPDPDANGADSFRFRVSDGSGQSQPALVTVTIAPVNDAPSLSVGPDIEHPAGSAGAQSQASFFGFDAGPPDEDATQVPQAFLFDPIVDPAGVLLPGSLAGFADGRLAYTLSGRGGEAEIDVRVRDSGGTANGGIDLSAPRRFRIRVIPGTDLEVAIDDGRSLVLAGQSTVYAIVVANAGPNDVSAASLATTLPAALTDPAWTCVPALSTAPCPVPASGTGSLAALVNLPVGTALRFDLLATAQGNPGEFIDAVVAVAPPAGIVALDPGDDSATDRNVVVGEAVFADGFEGPVLSTAAGWRALGATDDGPE